MYLTHTTTTATILTILYGTSTILVYLSTVHTIELHSSASVNIHTLLEQLYSTLSTVRDLTVCGRAGRYVALIEYMPYGGDTQLGHPELLRPYKIIVCDL